MLSVFLCNCCAWCLGLLELEVPFHPCSLAPPFSSTKGDSSLGRGPLAGLPWIPPSYARALPCSTNFVGTNAQAHLLVMTLNVAKCNLGKVNLEAMLVSSFPSYTWGGLMPLAGAPCDSYMQLLACSSSQSVVAIACCLRAILCFGFCLLTVSACTTTARRTTNTLAASLDGKNWLPYTLLHAKSSVPSSPAFGKEDFTTSNLPCFYFLIGYMNIQRIHPIPKHCILQNCDPNTLLESLQLSSGQKTEKWNCAKT